MQSQQLPTESQVFEDEVLPDELKALTIQPRKCRSDTIMARILAEKPESSFAPSHSFRRCTTFWRGTALHKGRVRSKFSVGQEVKKEILVEEVAL